MRSLKMAVNRKMDDPFFDKLVIRFAVPGDTDYLAGNLYISIQIVKRKIESNEILVVELSEEQIGFLQLEYLWSSVPYIALIRVSEAHRRKGIGKAL